MVAQQDTDPLGVPDRGARAYQVDRPVLAQKLPDSFGQLAHPAYGARLDAGPFVLEP